jgi:hypothetical protein
MTDAVARFYDALRRGLPPVHAQGARRAGLGRPPGASSPPPRREPPTRSAG